MGLLTEVEWRWLRALSLLSGLTLVLFFIRLAATHTGRFLFIPENLVLAWLPLALAWLLVRGLKTYGWLGWRNILLTLLWLFFLPNSWYVLTDFIHVYPTGEISQLFDIVLISSLALSGLALGFASLYIVHRHLLKYLSRFGAYSLIEVVILLSSFAIYLGRVLRWSSWDVVIDPGVLINVSNRIIDPLGAHRADNITGLFFILLSILYLTIWLVAEPKITERR